MGCYCCTKSIYALLVHNKSDSTLRELNSEIHDSKHISSVESQKGAVTVQRCSIENQKGTIAVQSLWQ